MPEGPGSIPRTRPPTCRSRLLAAEITREKIYHRLHDELPYASAVETEKWEERKDGSVRIDQVIYVQREGQKAIVLGKGGKTIKIIGATGARRDGRIIRPPRASLPVREGATRTGRKAASIMNRWASNFPRASDGVDLTTAISCPPVRMAKPALMLDLFTREHGRHAGLVRGSKARAAAAAGQRPVGYLAGASAGAIGQFAVELARARAGSLMESRERPDRSQRLLRGRAGGVAGAQAHAPLYDVAEILLDAMMAE